MAAKERLASELRTICSAGLAELLLLAHEVAAFCQEHRIPLSARGSATSSLVAWALGLVELCPLDHGLDGRSFVYEGRPDLPDLDLEVSSLYEPLVARFLLRPHRGEADLSWTSGSVCDGPACPDYEPSDRQRDARAPHADVCEEQTGEGEHGRRHPDGHSQCPGDEFDRMPCLTDSVQVVIRPLVKARRRRGS
jgi:hypothetical protein